MTEDEMVGEHLLLNGHEFEEAPDVGDEQVSLVCCSPESQKVWHKLATELNQKRTTWCFGVPVHCEEITILSQSTYPDPHIVSLCVCVCVEMPFLKTFLYSLFLLEGIL